MRTDLILHFGACAAVSAVTTAVGLLLGGQTAAAMATGTLAGIAAGAAKEYGDSVAVGNHWDWLDIAADVVGAIVGAALVGLIFRMI